MKSPVKPGERLNRLVDEYGLGNPPPIRNFNTDIHSNRFIECPPAVDEKKVKQYGPNKDWSKVENVQGKAIVQTIARFSKFVDSGNRSRVASFTQP